MLIISKNAILIENMNQSKEKCFISLIEEALLHVVFNFTNDLII